MDSLPSIVLVRILSFLSAEDVTRFKLLNSTFVEVIKTNRRYLKRRSIEVEIFECTNNVKDVKDVHLIINNKWECTIHPSAKEGVVLVAPWRSCFSVECHKSSRLPTLLDDLELDIGFFGPRLLKMTSYRTIFDAIFEETDVCRLYLVVRYWDCLADLCDSITTTEIRCIFKIPWDFFDTACEHLLRFANRLRDIKERDRVNISIQIENGVTTAENLQRMDEIASLIDGIQFTLDSPDFLYQFALSWKKDRFSTPNLTFYLNTIFNMESWIAREQEHFVHFFDVSVTEGKNDEKTIEFKDRRTKDILKFILKVRNDGCMEVFIRTV